MSRAAVDRQAGASTFDEQPRRRWNASRWLPVIVTGSWAAMFWWLWLSGRRDLFLSSKTGWVVPMAAIALSVATTGAVITTRRAAGGPVARATAWTAAALLLPVLLVVTMAPTTLGGSSSGRRAAFAGAGTSVGDITSGDLTLIDVATAQSLPGGMRELAARAGETVDFTGVVTRNPDTPADELLLTRYVVSCCVADATVTQVRVVNVPPGAFAADQWVQVQGTIYPVGTEVIVDASAVTAVPAPEKPYLTP